MDDSQAGREILSSLCEGAGLVASVAASGAEALALCCKPEQDVPFDFILCDWKMATMDGVELLRQIQTHSTAAIAPKCIMVTAFDRDRLLADASDIHIDAALTKPVSASTLVDTLMSVSEDSDISSPLTSAATIDLSAANAIAGAKILLVEDNATNQQVAIELLEMAHFEITTAWNGQEAIEIINQRHFDAVLMDVQMPVMDGLSATKAIRSEPQFTDLPIIAMTANAMSGDRERCIEVGMNDHIAKPINPQAIYQTLAKWIKPTGKVIQPKTDKLEPDVPQLDLPGFNVTEAVERFGGSQKAFQRTLEQVLRTDANIMTQVREALAKGDTQTAHRAAHSLKGIAGNIGAEFLVAPVAQLEKWLSTLEPNKQPYDSVGLTELVQRCDALTSGMINTIQTALARSSLNAVLPSKASDTSTTIENLLQELTKLKEQIEMYDSSAVDRLERVIDTVEPSELRDQLESLMQALSDFDFDTSDAMLGQIIAQTISSTT